MIVDEWKMGEGIGNNCGRLGIFIGGRVMIVDVWQ